ncbi:U8 snoRNA-decapping enzyme [Orchesella cincta]|uniref:U8 snoRNA-decapping enzyme n=1 Tax=Orchesella cincta TaxID=48709 RepID=A0A1D2MRN3_ORCCI|nr:U8 snoRNA-decapping enzyme [Orchesella cincta]
MMDNTKVLEEETSSTSAHKCPWMPTSYVDCTDFELMKKAKIHAAHVLLWSRDEKPVSPYHYDDIELPMQTKILMQVRFDGSFGFPGGFVDELESKVPSSFPKFLELLQQGVCRELFEEMGFGRDTSPSYVYSCHPAGREKDVMLHFFMFQLTPSQMKAISWGSIISTSDEVVGLSLVPLYTMKDGIRGLPTFLTNSFAGNAVEQLLRCILKQGFLSEVEVRKATEVAFKILKKRGGGDLKFEFQSHTHIL